MQKRLLLIAIIAFSVSCIAVPVHADWTFICEDGRSVTLDRKNWTALQEHPCVKAWHAQNAAQDAGLTAAQPENDNAPRYAGGVARGEGAVQPVSLQERSQRSGTVHVPANSRGDDSQERPRTRIRLRRR
jgi:hypothetical protein